MTRRQTDAAKIISEMRKLLPEASAAQRLKIIEMIEQSLLKLEPIADNKKTVNSDYLDER